MTPKYAVEKQFDFREMVDLYHRSTLAERRPVDELERLQRMVLHSDILATARDEKGLLIGLSRAITDFAYCTYVADLAVDQQFQRRGIGRRLVQLTHETAGLDTTLILLSAPAARSYYPHIGMTQHESCWTLPGRS